MRDMKIVCLGDSNTWGYDPRDPLGGRYDRIWTEVLSEKTGWNVINQGENGRKIPEESVPIPSGTDLLIVMLGTNDLLEGKTPADISKHMERFLGSMALNPVKLLLIAPPPMIMGAWVQDQKLIGASAALADHYRDLAVRLGIRFADAGDWQVSLAYDGVHFTEDGHRSFASGLIEYLQQQLQEDEQ